MKKRTTLRDLAILYKIPNSTLSDRLRGNPSRYEAQQKYQATSPAVEQSLIEWVDDMDGSCMIFPIFHRAVWPVQVYNRLFKLARAQLRSKLNQ